MAGEDAVANRMHVKAAENSAATVQNLVEDVAEEREGDPPEVIADALKETWVDEYGETAEPIADETVEVIAEHVAKGDEVIVVPPERPGTDASD